MPVKLPEYDNPPLNEVVIGVQFESLKKFTASHLGLFWSRIRTEYPKSEDNHPLLHQKELFDPTPSSANDQQFLIATGKVPRSWFLSTDGRQLIQLQHDQFLRNWRKLTPDDEYPR